MSEKKCGGCHFWRMGDGGRFHRDVQRDVRGCQAQDSVHYRVETQGECPGCSIWTKPMLAEVYWNDKA